MIGGFRGEVVSRDSRMEGGVQGVGHDHVHYQSNCIFAKIFHVSPQATVQKIDRGTGISKYLGSTCLYYNEVVFARKNRSVVEK